MGNKTIWLFIGFLFLAGCAGTDQSVKNLEVIKEVEKLELEVKEIDRGVEIIFPEVLLFEFNSDRLKLNAKAKMHKIAEILNGSDVKSRTIAVEGHTDSVGPTKYNMSLSERRAETVGRALVFSGVRKERLAAKGFGESKPLTQNRHPDGTDNPEGRARNRRVEVIIEN